MLVDTTATEPPCTTVPGVTETVVVLGMVGPVIVNVAGADADDL